MNTLRSPHYGEILAGHPLYPRLFKALAQGSIRMVHPHGPVLAHCVAQLMRKVAGNTLVVLPSERDVEACSTDLAGFGITSRVLPWWNTLAYSPLKSGSHVFGERARVLTDCIAESKSLREQPILASMRAFITPLPPLDYFKQYIVRFAVGDFFDHSQIKDTLVRYGYLRVPRVGLPGEFSLRGEVLDVLLPGSEDGVRIVLDFDKIEKIITFDTVSQTPLGKIDSLVIGPRKEVVWDDDLIAIIGRLVEKNDTGNGRTLVDSLGSRREASGEELFYPLLFEKQGSIYDYLGEESLVVLGECERLDTAFDSIKKEYLNRYRSTMKEWPIPTPAQSLLPFETMIQDPEPSQPGKRFLKTYLFTRSEHAGVGSDFDFGVEDSRSFFGNIKLLKTELAALTAAGYTIFVAAGSEIQASRVQVLLEGSKLQILGDSISSGFSIPAMKLMVIHDGEIFGRRRRLAKSLRTARTSVIDNFFELETGDYVVHLNHGIGRFDSIDRITTLGLERDYIKLEFADEEYIFVPIEQANLIQHYIGSEGATPKLDRIGSKSWEARKSKVRKSVQNLAEKLIRLYASRKASRGYAFPPDSEWQLEFEASFPWEETEDQLRCIEEVKADMEKDAPMDRLICGDVGFGKTEVALRAMFKAASAGKQAALLAPTTILTEQHFENIKERIQKFPMRIAMLSRLVSKADQKIVLEDLREGRCDVVVGTHRLLQKDVQFKNLGLLVIDEEQRFGVAAKERLKELKTDIDCLSLSATPIPRTLHMSLLKIRDMSILNTPPANRQPIETIVQEYDPAVVAHAIREEVKRGGQIFYLHNRIESLEEIRFRLSQLVPEVMIECAHGRMDGTEIEDIMHRFINGGFQVLISTTIIENGIDIPNVNTIIIDKATMYGISQLYQLRGRVGRSDRTSYAYLLYKDSASLSELAAKRLAIISNFTELGSGFKIAMKDLEIRGAGSILGREQSGDIYAVGFDLYLKLLDESVRSLVDKGFKPEEEPFLELQYSGFIPDEYIPTATVKMEMYKKIASVYNQEDIDALCHEMEDRFGPMPEEVLSLISMAETRILCRKLSIASLIERGKKVTIEFSRVAVVSAERVVRLIAESGRRVRIDPARPNVMVIDTQEIEEKQKSDFIKERLSALCK